MIALSHNAADRPGNTRDAGPVSTDSGERRDTALYIADLALELRNLAKGAELQSTRSLLELTYYAAYAAAHQVEMPEGELERLDRLGEDARRAGAAVVAAAAE